MERGGGEAPFISLGVEGRIAALMAQQICWCNIPMSKTYSQIHSHLSGQLVYTLHQTLFGGCWCFYMLWTNSCIYSSWWDTEPVKSRDGHFRSRGNYWLQTPTNQRRANQICLWMSRVPIIGALFDQLTSWPCWLPSSAASPHACLGTVWRFNAAAELSWNTRIQQTNIHRIRISIPLI